MKWRMLLWAAAAAVGAMVGTARADLGDVVFGPIDVEIQNLETGNLGVEFLNDVYYVSARGLVTPPHKVYTFDVNGVMTGSFDQHSAVWGSAWGYRDGATDGTLIYFGSELGIHAHDPADPTNPFVVISGGGLNGTWRALAYDPTGDGGNGSFWSASHDSALIEVDMSGNVLTNFPNAGWSLYGLAWDPITGNLWGHHGIRPVGGHPPPKIVEIDTTTGLLTGVEWQSDAGVPGTPPDWPVNGGLAMVPGGAGGSGNLYDLVALLQADNDAIVGFELYPAACPADVNGDNVVDVLDLLAVIAAWGNPGGPEDVNGDGVVDVLDLLAVISAWGPC